MKIYFKLYILSIFVTLFKAQEPECNAQTCPAGVGECIDSICLCGPGYTTIESSYNSISLNIQSKENWYDKIKDKLTGQISQQAENSGSAQSTIGSQSDDIQSDDSQSTDNSQSTDDPESLLKYPPGSISNLQKDSNFKYCNYVFRYKTYATIFEAILPFGVGHFYAYRYDQAFIKFILFWVLSFNKIIFKKSIKSYPNVEKANKFILFSFIGFYLADITAFQFGVYSDGNGMELL